jgi:hypothetical protein
MFRTSGRKKVCMDGMGWVRERRGEERMSKVGLNISFSSVD